MLEAFAHADPAEQKWRSRVFGTSIQELTETERTMERNDYVRFTDGVWKLTDKHAGSDPPTDLERQYILFKLGTLYLFERETYKWPDAWPKLQPKGQPFGHEVDEATAIEGSQVYMRKLMGLPKLYDFARFFIARVQELDGVPLPRWAKVPAGAQRWVFNRFSKAEGATVVDDLEAEYRESKKQPMRDVANVACPFAFGILPCLRGAESYEQRTLSELRDGVVTLVVFKDGKDNLNGQANR